MSARKTSALVLHALSVAIMVWGYMDLENTVLNSYIARQKGGHSQYLTIQSLIISCFTMFLSLCCDIFPSQLLKRTKRAFFLIALPLSFVVTSIYWSLILLFPSLILKSAPSPQSPTIPTSSHDPSVPALVRIPLSLDLALHFVPAFSLTMDFLLFEESYGRRAVNEGALAMSAAFCVWYAAWVEYCASFNKGFPYPFLTISPLPVRLVIYVIVTMIALLSLRVMNAAHLRLIGWVALPRGKTA